MGNLFSINHVQIQLSISHKNVKISDNVIQVKKAYLNFPDF